MRRLFFVLFFALYALLSTAAADSWSLDSLYPDPDAATADAKYISEQLVPAMTALDVSKKSGALRAFYSFDDASYRLSRLFAYASLRQAADSTDTFSAELQNYLFITLQNYENCAMSLRLKLAALRDSKLLAWARKPEFEPYRDLLAALAACKPEQLSEALGFNRAAPLAALPALIAQTVLTSDFLPDSVSRPDGGSAPATLNELRKATLSGDKAYADTARQAYFRELEAHKHTLSASLNAYVAHNARLAAAAGFNTTLDKALVLPLSAEAALLDAVSDLLPHASTKATGSDNDDSFSFDEAKALVLDALKPLGSVFSLHAERILNSSHIDAFPRDLKQNGAFSMAVPGSDPYILLNFDGSYSSVSTLAHELGHAVHYVMAYNCGHSDSFRPPVPVTEAVAISCELLLARRLNNTAAANELVIGTILSQSRLHEFEKNLYTLVENGGAVTADKAADIWNNLAVRYNGSKPASAYGWLSVPHFYRSFYVVNYAFAAAAASQLVDNLIKNGPDSFVSMINAGGSMSAEQLFLGAGVNLSDENLYKLALQPV